MYDLYDEEFQKELIQIKKWNNNIIDEEYKRIVKSSKCKYLADLIKIIIITTIKIKIYEYKDYFDYHYLASNIAGFAENSIQNIFS